MPPSPPRRIPSPWRTRCAWQSTRGEPRTSPVACRGARSPYPRHRSKGCWIRDATAARRAALRILQSVRAGATFAAARDRHLAGLAEGDRLLAYQLAGGVLRCQADLDRALALATVDPRLDDILRLGAYQLRALARVPAYAAVSTSVELARDAAGEGGARFVNQALRRGAGAGGPGEGGGPAPPPMVFGPRGPQVRGQRDPPALPGDGAATPPGAPTAAREAGE